MSTLSKAPIPKASPIPKTESRSSAAARSHPAHRPSAVWQHPILPLQRGLGNQAMLRLLQNQAANLMTASLQHYPGQTAAIPAAAVIQTKLAINRPGDEFEQEADRVADQVMRMPEPQVQRQCACGGTCSECSRQHSQDDHGPIQMKQLGPAGPAHAEAPPSVHEALRSPGRPLDAATRAYMEPRFGHDFSPVRMHTDAAAAQSALDINARASQQDTTSSLTQATTRREPL